MRCSSKTQAEETTMKILKMHSLIFEVLQLTDNWNILSTFNQGGPPGRCVVWDTSFKIWAWILSTCQILWNPQDHSLCPLCPWDFPGKNTGVDCHLLLQSIFWTQGWNHYLLPCRQRYLPLSHWDSIDTLEYVSQLLHVFSPLLWAIVFDSFAQVFVGGDGVACLEEFFAQISWKFFLSPALQPHNIALCCIFIRQLSCLGNHPWSKALEFCKITHFGS